MKTKLLAFALLASVALIAPAEAGNGRNGGGGGGFAAPARSGGAGPSFRSAAAGRYYGGGQSFRSMPVRSFSGNRTLYSGQRFSPVGPQVQRSTAFRSQRLQSNVGGNVYRANRVPGFASSGNQSIADVSRQSNGQFRNRGNQFQNGNGFARNSNAAIRNQRSAQFGNGNGNARLRSDWHNHVVAQHSANWHSNWDHHLSHWWHGHNWCFIGGSWFAFDLGFYPWWPWGYPYDYYYGYGYGYPYNYGYYPYGYNNYDSGYGYNDSGAYDNGGYGQNGYGNQDANSTVAAVQDRLARDGYYRGQIDGVLGPETRHAILRYQSNHGLRVTGELTADTLDAMGLQQSDNYSSY
jgi:hypothetical protein